MVVDTVCVKSNVSAEPKFFVLTELVCFHPQERVLHIIQGISSLFCSVSAMLMLNIRMKHALKQASCAPFLLAKFSFLVIIVLLMRLNCVAFPE